MDLAIRVNVRYAAPVNSQIKDALLLFKSARWVHSIIRYIIPQLNNVSPAAIHLLETIKNKPADVRQHKNGERAVCVVCMEALVSPCAELPTCCHQFHERCIEPWLKMHSTCPTCRHQLPTDAHTSYSVYAINTTIVLQQSQSNMPAAELLDLSASNQVIQAIVNARVRRNAASTSAIDSFMRRPSDISTEVPVLNASVLQHSSRMTASLPPCITEPVVPVIHRNASRRRFREQDAIRAIGKRRRLSGHDIATS
ncbi:conserved hypothetical protein [Plasmopara halstedii]|uniref:RING-type domain-containing protein n=1 Tax=Plasmopara halstedii TaxID=4781 RepID=A0A0P1AB71_PLAHL|nr:conserved hypothetical protein [Plasmopara halstedii]CEG37852.1 conserved hypothetical protein [Plasmopara halstedii]|eukprot:XP_024574221.1 conserved hypothetical protein [Plasmopara halstedii]